MLLALDVGNTEIKLGIISEDTLLAYKRIVTDRAKTAEDYAEDFKNAVSDSGVDLHGIKGAAVSCVVSQISQKISDAVYMLIGKRPFVVAPGIKLGVELCIDEPDTLGADLAVCCAAVCKLYSCPAVVIGLGTATTFCVIDKNGRMQGGCIMPGAALSENALIERTGLPQIEYTAPDSIIGKNTDECMRSGLVTGTAAMIDGVCDRIENELGYRCNIIAAGGLADVIIPSCKKEITVDKHLMFKGLKILYEMNCE